MPEMAALREALVANLEAGGTIRTPAIAAAMRAVAREHFVPDPTPERAYADEALPLKEHAHAVISSISQPSIVAHMLELLHVREDSRVLEIGTGSGYNAALLAQLALHGLVTSVEIEDDLLQRARRALDADGFARVRLIDDAAFASDNARYDRIIVTARARDIDSRWWERLVDGGRIVVPLDLGYGGERVVAFARSGERLVSDGSCACAFVALRAVDDPQSAIFFRSRFERFRGSPAAQRPLDIVAIERTNAKPSFLEECDAVVAQTHTLFALKRL
jgi:protein-L-isoaspartate(D-aspartate) O-methyltransferase